MDSPPPELGFSLGITFAEAMKAILIGIGSITLWLLKKLGDKHMSSLDKVLEKQDLILNTISTVDKRVTLLEYKVENHLRRDDIQ
jgi:hypothetical protein